MGFGFLAFTTLSLSQEEVDPSELIQKKTAKTWRLANEAKRTNNTYLAINYYEQIYHKDTTDSRVILELADLYRRTNNYLFAEIFYTKIVDSKNGDKYPDALFYLGKTQKNNEKYTEAAKTFGKFKKVYKDAKNENLQKLYKAELQGCHLAMDSSEAKVQFQSLGDKVNKPHIEFSPIPITDDKIIYGSYKEDQVRVYELNDTVPFEIDKRKFFIAEKENDIWTRKITLPGPFNDPTMDVANGCFSLDSTRFYFSKCAPNWQYKMVCAIYESKLHNGKWSEPDKLNELVNMPDYTSSHPTMGRESRRNNELIYFVSDRPGSKGSTDIWVTEYDARRKKFKKPRNAGSRINTVGTEMTPFYDIQSKTLYYSTDGFPTIGGLDIYSNVGEGSKWETSLWTGKGLNSSADDLDFALKPSNRGGFFISNRPSGESLYHSTCCDDIYEFEYNEFIEIILDLCVYGKNKELLNGDATVNVFIRDSTGQLLVTTKTMQEICTKFPLRPGKEYVFEVKKPDYFPSSGTISTEGILKSTNLKKDIELERIPEEPMIIGNIQYDFDSPNLTQDSKNILDTTLLVLFKKYSNVQIEIRAHTDSKGTDEYNMRLSQKRAESVIRYLKSKGIPEVQMIAKGYGETIPIVPNAYPDGTDDPKGREKNRRTEFKILGEVEQGIINIDEDDDVE
ncbi:OmpA family protein [Crocinitomicaceae bacterium]|nr:OmpA family protein [Crocinitomicaceae bacterium]